MKHTYHRQGHRRANHLPANTATAGDVYVADYGADGVLPVSDCLGLAYAGPTVVFKIIVAERSSSSASIRAAFGVRPSASRAMWRIASSSPSSESMVSMSRIH